MATETITSEQKKQYLRFVENTAESAFKEVGLDKDGFQKLIESGDEFQACIIAGIREISMSNQFASEEVRSNFVYPVGYKVKAVTEQINTLHQFFSGIGRADENLVSQPLPANAEGWFAVPRWQKIAETYEEAIKEVLGLISQQHGGKFRNWCKDKLGTQYFCQHERSVKKLQVLGDQQKDYDIIVVPCQFGLRHGGRSVRRAREVFLANEFGLGAFEIGCMLLTHPERLVSFDDLRIDCAGDEYPSSLGSGATFFFFDYGGIIFGADYVSDLERSGSATGFLP